MAYVGHDYVVGRDAVGGDKEEGLGVDFVDLAHFTAGNLLEAMLLDCVVSVIVLKSKCSLCHNVLRLRVLWIVNMQDDITYLASRSE